MRLLLRKLSIFIIAAGLALSGVTTHAGAAMMFKDGAASLHEVHQVQNYADLAIEPGEQDCPHMAADTPMKHQTDDGLCKKCCAAYTSASLIPTSPFPILILSEKRETYSMSFSTLVAHRVPTDPGIPKPL